MISILRKYLIIFLLPVVLAPAAAMARPVIADLSLRKIEIDSSFKGTEILLFGARNDAGDIIVVVRGPKFSYIMRKKEKIAGIWVNRNQVIFKDISGYYNVSASRPISEIKNDHLLNLLDIGIDNINLPIQTNDDVEAAEFQKAFLKKKEAGHLYSPTVGEVQFIGDTLFRTIIQFPENIPRGVYTAEVYLFSDGQLSGFQTTPLIVKKIGFDAFVYDFSYRFPIIYGIIAVLIALGAGWLAGVLFRKV